MKRFLSTAASLILVVLLSTTLLHAQTFNESIDIFDADQAHNVEFTPVDGGQITTGYSEDPAGKRWMNLVKTGPGGAVLWAQIYDLGLASEGFDVEPTLDGGYAITGYVFSPGSLFKELILVKTDAFGTMLWSVVFPHPGGDAIGYSLEQLPDSGYVMTGSWFNPLGNFDVTAVRTNPAGLMMAHFVYDTGFDEEGFSIKPDVAPLPGIPSGFIITGYSRMTFPGLPLAGKNVLAIKTDPFLFPLWMKEYGGGADDVGHAVESLGPSYIIAGESASFTNGKKDIYQLMIDPFGAVIWSSVYGHKRDEVALSVEHFSDGTLMSTGWTTSGAGATQDAFVMKTDLAGTIIYNRLFGGPRHDSGRSIKEAITAAGLSETIIAGVYNADPAVPVDDRDIYLIRTDAPADSACPIKRPFLQLHVPPFEFDVPPNFFPVALCVPFPGFEIPVPPIVVDRCCSCADMTPLFAASNIAPVAGETVLFTNLSTCIDAFRWAVDGVILAGSTNFSYTFAAPGTYTITLYGRNKGCPIVSYSFTIVVGPSPLPRLGASSDEGLSIFPNPATEQTSVVIEAMDAGTRYTLSVFDATGRRVYAREGTSEGASTQVQLDLQKLAEGIYQVVVDRTDARLQGKLVIVR